jgi:murein DD-endopeptidase MepM/ murein hydrolase activator NlpD
LGVLVCGIFQNNTPRAVQCQQFLQFYNSKQADWGPALANLFTGGFWLDSFNREVYQSNPPSLPAGATIMSIPVSGKFTRGFGWLEAENGKPRTFHAGIDIQAVAGTSIRAALAGVAGTVGEDPQEGKFVEIKHNQDLVTRYAGLGEIMIKSGQNINQDQAIARLGKQAELHFEIKEKGLSVDPYPRLISSESNI